MLRAHISRTCYLQSILLFALGTASTSCLDRPVVKASPRTTARFLRAVDQTRVDKIDLLFMIDDSRSMADKQKVLSEAVPNLLERLVNPDCLREDGSPVKPSVDGICPSGTKLDFDPVKDIHIGVITSSLGAYGATARKANGDVDKLCEGEQYNRRAHLVPAENADFLSWRGGGATESTALSKQFTTMVGKPGQDGCGYEAQLESVYRFLVDPEPYQDVETKDGEAVPIGIDTDILNQRASFLRPDSLVAILLLTDENDSSNKAEGQGFYPLSNPNPLRRATSACKTNVNDECCFNCGAKNPPANCPSPADDVECKKGPFSEVDDSVNIRNSMQKYRYGMDFLYPIERWVEGFTQPRIKTRSNKEVDNPLFSDLQCKGTGCKASRLPNMVYVAGIVGVPWQDIARDATDLKKGFQTAEELDKNGTWDVILGKPRESPPVLPKDPLMIESVEPREANAGSGQHAAAPPDAKLWANKKNGHEWDPGKLAHKNSDLQYACIFRLNEPRRPSKTSTGDTIPVEDCENSKETKNPLCQNPDNGEYGDTQYFAKAYPGTRQLELLKALGNQAIVASICPATTDEDKKNERDYGYRPAVDALVDRLRLSLRGQCLPRKLEVDQDKQSPTYGQVPCVVLEAFNPSDGVCNCGDTERFPARSNADRESLDDATRRDYSCVCEIDQLAGSDRDQCQKVSGESNDLPDGWCYVDPYQGGSCELVSDCSPDMRRLIRFVGKAKPRIGSRVIIECQESPSIEERDADVCRK